MENAVKALLIAAGMLLAVMIISLLVMGYDRISSYYEQQNELLTAEQLNQFNKQFQNYNRSDIRGNELISLMNKIIDYNASQSYQVGTDYEPIKVTITIGGSDITDQFKFKYKQNGIEIPYGTDIINDYITNTTGGGTSYSNDRQLVNITNTPQDLIDLAKDNANNSSLLPSGNPDVVFTDTQLQKLEMEIPNIIIEENDDAGWEDTKRYRASENRRNRAVLLKNILQLVVTADLTETEYDIKVDKDNYYKTYDGQDKIDKIKEIVSQYHQYIRFKRAHFECTELLHDSETGRVVEMNFKVQTDDEGNVIMN